MMYTTKYARYKRMGEVRVGCNYILGFHSENGYGRKSWICIHACGCTASFIISMINIITELELIDI